MWRRGGEFYPLQHGDAPLVLAPHDTDHDPARRQHIRDPTAPGHRGRRGSIPNSTSDPVPARVLSIVRERLQERAEAEDPACCRVVPCRGAAAVVGGRRQGEGQAQAEDDGYDKVGPLDGSMMGKVRGRQGGGLLVPETQGVGAGEQPVGVDGVRGACRYCWGRRRPVTTLLGIVVGES